MKSTMSIAETATVLNVSEEFVRDLVSKGVLPMRPDDTINHKDVIAHSAARTDQRETALTEIVALGESEDPVLRIAADVRSRS